MNLATDEISDREVHVWLTHPEAISNRDDLLGRYDKLLSDVERERHRRFLFERHRHHFLVARALVRTTLSRYAAVEPRDWRFVFNEHGRPSIAPEFGSRIRFNLSHTDGLIGIAVALEREVGFDVEAIGRRAETVDLADRYFSPQEVAELRALPEAQQRDRFFVYWTLKEAYIKARGLGLAIPLDLFSFHLEPGQEVRISFDPGLEDDPTSWQFLQRPHGGEHQLALAIRREPSCDLEVLVRDTVPLDGGSTT